MDVETLLARSQWRMVADRGKNGMSFVQVVYLKCHMLKTIQLIQWQLMNKSPYNKDFVLSIQEPEIDFTRLHELFHKIMKHHLRIGNRNPTIWNFACDFDQS